MILKDIKNSLRTLNSKQYLKHVAQHVHLHDEKVSMHLTMNLIRKVREKS